MNFAIDDYRDVFSILQKLHDLFALPGQLRPSGFSVRILFQSAQFAIFETEVNLLQPAFCSLANGIGFSVEVDVFLLSTKACSQTEIRVDSSSPGIERG
jgi:hypothetical protein